MGLPLAADDLPRRLAHLAGLQVTLSDELLEPASKHDVLARMLGNLAGVYRRDGVVLRSIAVLERILIVQPDNHQAERELAQLRKRAGELN
jgi:regulator of sirC expression with transglutaminase-like and TPR domain